MQTTQADAYVEKVSDAYAARTRPPNGTKVETCKASEANGRPGTTVHFYTFPDGSRARVDRDKTGPVDAQVI